MLQEEEEAERRGRRRRGSERGKKEEEKVRHISLFTQSVYTLAVVSLRSRPAGR